MKCLHCGQEHPDNTKFCPETGKKIEIIKESTSELIACTNPSCDDYGKKILPADSKFCPNCGTSIYRSNNLTECEIIGYIEDEHRFTFIDKYGNPIENIEKSTKLVSNCISGKQNFNFFQKGNNVFHITNYGIVSYGEDIDEASPIDNNMIEVYEANSKLPQIYNTKGVRLFENIKVGDVVKQIDEKYLIGMVSVDCMGIIEIKTGKVLLRKNLVQLNINEVSTMPNCNLISFSSYGNYFYHLDIDKKSLVRHDLPFIPKKLFVLDDRHILIREKYNKQYIYDINDNLICFTSKNPKVFGDVVVLEEERTLYLKSDMIYNYPIDIQIDHYGVIDGEYYGLIDLETGQIIVDLKYDDYTPIFNDKESIEFVCFWCKGRKNTESMVIFDIVKKRLFCTDVTKNISMISQQNNDIFIYTEDEISVVYNKDLNVKFIDDWKEYSTVIPMNDNLYYSKGNEFGMLVNNTEDPILTINKGNLVPLYGVNKILVISDMNIEVIDPLKQEKFECTLLNKSRLLSTEWCSLLHYKLIHDCLLRCGKGIFEGISGNSGLYSLEGLTTVDQKWNNIYYPNYEVTII